MSYAIFIAFVALTFLRPFDLFAPESAEYRPMLVLTLLTLLVAVATPSCRKQAAAKSKPLVLALLFWLVIVASWMSQGEFSIAFSAALHFAPAALMFILALMNIDSLKRLKTTCLVMAFSTVLVALLGIASFHTGYMADRLVIRQIEREDPYQTGPPREEVTVPAEDKSGVFLYRIRNVGFLMDPNDMAQAMVVALPLLAGLHQRGRLASSAVLIGVPYAILLYATYLTHSRGAILAIGALMLLTLRRRLGNVVSVVLLVAAGMVGLAMGLGGTRGFSASDSSAGGRIDAWSAGLIMLRQNPLFGVGYLNFSDQAEITAHNTLVLCFGELGLVGFFIWMGLLVLAFKGLIRTRQTMPPDTEEYRWAGLLQTSLVGFLVCGFFLSRAYVVNYFLLLALCYCAWHSARDRQLLRAPAVPIPPFRWVLLSLFLIVGTVVGIVIIVRMKYAGLLSM